MQMSTFDTLSAFESLIATGITHEQAKVQTILLAQAAAPDIDLKARFDAIDRRFDQVDKKFEIMDKDFFYIRWLGITIMASIIGMMIANFYR